jgi:DNA-binding transcriptional ArsR family regulator
VSYHGHDADQEEGTPMTARSTRARTTEEPEDVTITLQGVLDAIADPVRRGIVRQLARSADDMPCGTFDINVSRSTGTHHFKVLREAGIIQQYYVGTSRFNSLCRAQLDDIFPGLLDALVLAADREHCAG